MSIVLLGSVPFIPKFIVVKKSYYRNGEASFIVTDQESALTAHCDDVKHELEQNPGSFPQNPCHYGFIFSGVDILLEVIKINTVMIMGVLVGSECGINVVKLFFSRHQLKVMSNLVMH